MIYHGCLAYSLKVPLDSFALITREVLAKLSLSLDHYSIVKVVLIFEKRLWLKGSLVVSFKEVLLASSSLVLSRSSFCKCLNRFLEALKNLYSEILSKNGEHLCEG